MNVDFARPSVSDLVFQAYGRSVHPELFQVYADLQVWQRSEEHTSELQSRRNLVCRLLLEKKKKGVAMAHA